MLRKTVSAVLLAVAVALGGCGGDDDVDAESQPSAGNEIDRAFVTEALPIHEKSVAIANVAQRDGKSGFVRQIASDIYRLQGQQIGTMRRIGTGLSADGVDVGKLGVPAPDTTAANPAALRAAESFDPAFLRAMIALHEATIAMANVELAKGLQSDLKVVARQMVDTESTELAAMRNQLK